MIFFQ